MAAIYLGALLLNLVWHSGGSPAGLLSVHPREALVELGGSVQLTCSMDCPHGKLQWLGLDTDLGNMVSNHTHSILTVANASVHAEGTKRCSGQCRGRHDQAKVDLHVYSFPDTLQLDSEPERVTAGQPARLVCSMRRVYPLEAVTLSWFQGGELLDSSMQVEEEEQLFVFRSVLEVPAAVAGVDYKCRVTLEFGEQKFERERAASVRIPVTEEATLAPFETVGTSHAAAPDSPATSSQSASFVATTNGHPPLLSTEFATSVASMVVATAAHMPEPLASADSPTTAANGSSGSPPPAENPTSGGAVSSSQPPAETDIAGDPTSTLPPVVETSAKLRATSQTPPSRDQPFTTKPISTKVLTEKPRSATPKEDLCRPVIVPAPRQGTTGEAFRITCRTAGCGTHIQTRWVETPLAQSQYGREEDDGWPALVVESVSLEHQGVYRCVTVASRPQMASLHVVVSDATFSTDTLVTLGTTGSLLGLIVTGYITHRLRRRRGS